MFAKYLLNPDDGKRPHPFFAAYSMSRPLLTHEHSCVHGFSLCGLKMRTYLFDRAGVLASYSFSIDEQPKRFISYILAYLCMDSDHLGFDPRIRVFTKSGSIVTYDGTVPHINLQPFLEVTIADKPKKFFWTSAKLSFPPPLRPEERFVGPPDSLGMRLTVVKPGTTRAFGPITSNSPGVMLRGRMRESCCPKPEVYKA